MRPSDSLIVSSVEPTGTNRKKVWMQKGKNLFDGILTIGVYSDTGEATTSEGAFRNVNRVSVGPSTTYIFSKDGVYMNMCVYFYDINKTYISAVGTKDSGQSGLGYFTTPDNCYYINFRCTIQ